MYVNTSGVRRSHTRDLSHRWRGRCSHAQTKGRNANSRTSTANLFAGVRVVRSNQWDFRMNQAEHDLLVIDAQDGSRTAMNALVAHHHRDLLRFAYSLCRNTALAQDAVQDAWIKVARRLRRLNDPRAFRGWVYHAVRWRVLDLLRADRGDCELDQATALTDAASDCELRDRRIDLGAAIACLAAIDRETLQLYYAAGLTIPEIAAVQEMPTGTVKSRLHRARSQLVQTLEGDNDEH